MRRILLVLTVALAMVAMMAVSGPAFAGPPIEAGGSGTGCNPDGTACGGGGGGNVLGTGFQVEAFSETRLLIQEAL